MSSEVLKTGTSYTAGLRHRKAGYQRVPLTEDIELGEFSEVPLTAAAEEAADVSVPLIESSGIGAGGAVAAGAAEFGQVAGGVIGGALIGAVTGKIAYDKSWEQFDQTQKNADKWMQDLQKKWLENAEKKQKITIAQQELERRAQEHLNNDEVLTKHGWVPREGIKYNNRGWVVPPFEYLGPGNDINDNKKPINEVDEDARQHDISYQNNPGNVRPADNEFKRQQLDHIIESINLNEHPLNTLGAAIGYSGIKAKTSVEDILNRQLYPSEYNYNYYEQYIWFI